MHEFRAVAIQTPCLYRTWVNPDDVIPSKINQIHKDKYCLIPYTEGKFRKTESRRVVSRGWVEEEMGTFLLSAHRVSVLQAEKVLEICYPTRLMWLTLLK